MYVLTMINRTEKRKALQFDMRCKVIGRDFDRECEFLQGRYNGAAFNIALLLQKWLRNISL